jgi:hypothetical protein
MTHQFKLLLACFVVRTLSQRPQSSGWSDIYYSASIAMELSNPINQVPESLTYQPSTGRIITSNTINSQLFGTHKLS